MKRAMVLISLLLTGCGNSYDVVSSAMEPTLHPGTRVLIDQQYYETNAVERYDLIVFERPTSGGPDLKRVIGLPGERIAVAGGDIYINGVALVDDLPKYPKNLGHRSVAIPEGHYFVLGDNREGMSLDSSSYGPIPGASILGKVVQVRSNK